MTVYKAYMMHPRGDHELKPGDKVKHAPSRTLVTFQGVTDDGLRIAVNDGGQFPLTEFPGVRVETIEPQPVKRQVGTVDLTPTWSGILPALLFALEDGTDEGKRIAREELKRMAQAADAYNASVKE